MLIESFRRRRALGALALSVMMAPVLSTPVLAQWKTFKSPSIVVDIPRDLFSGEATLSENETRFSSNDGRANLTLRSYPASGKTPRQFLADLRPPQGIVYSRIGENFFVVSSFRDSKIWYNRCNFSRQSVGCLLLDYPASEKTAWDGPVTRMSGSLRAF